MLKVQGLSLSRVRLLRFIAQAGQTRSVDVAEAFGYAPRTVTEALDGLERAGLIARRASVEDRRSKVIELSESGEAALALAAPVARRFVEDVFTALDEGEQDVLAALVERLTARLDQLASDRLAAKAPKAGPDQ
ncbi:MarR family transcriptional regulator [Sphingomonas sp. BIUV-7]|uniref:MarR family transcriptional regulator n=1 Tax=Sphingomonas natans TaxID=3063330 RepID=A0ABT8Y3Q8_9SPHN|nr:MarR family transcriptional regulator [Sphingomonas sp. BIUV-7]MDO6412944.1 MarR family transcriptional regulator [Sphingomonas sp. BIUV-7]